MAKRDVVRFLVRLFGDPVHHGRYRKQPDRVMKAAGLSPSERDLLASGDAAAIRAYLGKESAKTNVVKSGLTNVVKTSATNVVKTAATNVVKTAVTNVVKTAITNVVKTAIRKPKKPKPPKPRQ
jgi:hypothetical protein